MYFHSVSFNFVWLASFPGSIILFIVAHFTMQAKQGSRAWERYRGYVRMVCLRFNQSFVFMCPLRGKYPAHVYRQTYRDQCQCMDFGKHT